MTADLPNTEDFTINESTNSSGLERVIVPV